MNFAPAAVGLSNLLDLRDVFWNHLAVPIYKCPRCDGNSVYFAQRPRVTGRNIYGDVVSMVNVALCKVCAEEMNVIVTAEERAKSWSDFKGFLKVFMIISAVILVLLGGLYIWAELAI